MIRGGLGRVFRATLEGGGLCPQLLLVHRQRVLLIGDFRFVVARSSSLEKQHEGVVHES